MCFMTDAIRKTSCSDVEGLCVLRSLFAEVTFECLEVLVEPVLIKAHDPKRPEARSKIAKLLAASKVLEFDVAGVDIEH